MLAFTFYTFTSIRRKSDTDALFDIVVYKIGII